MWERGRNQFFPGKSACFCRCSYKNIPVYLTDSLRKFPGLSQPPPRIVDNCGDPDIRFEDDILFLGGGGGEEALISSTADQQQQQGQESDLAVVEDSFASAMEQQQQQFGGPGDPMGPFSPQVTSWRLYTV